MTDRDLLELAAKAAGIDGPFVGLDDRPEWMIVHHGEGIYSGPDGAWNPLIDDGDAFRLAVKLGLSVFALYHVGADLRQGTGVLRHGEPMPPEFWRSHGSDPCAATREAIVRAAAEIGKQPPTS